MRLPRRPRARNPVVSSPASALTQQARGPVFYKDCCNNEREDFRGEGGLSTMQSTIRIAAPATPSPHPYVTPDSLIGECLLRISSYPPGGSARGHEPTDASPAPLLDQHPLADTWGG